MGSALRVNFADWLPKGFKVEVTVQYSTGSGAAALQFLEKEYGKAVFMIYLRISSILQTDAGEPISVSFQPMSTHLCKIYGTTPRFIVRPYCLTISCRYAVRETREY